MFAIILLGSITLLVYAVIRYYQYTARYPKGPRPLPFIGNFYDIDYKAQHESFTRLAKQHGGIFTVFTPVPYVQITDFKAMKEAYIEQGDAFTARPSHKFVQEAISYAPNAGVINSNGENWREQRRAAITILRDFGMGKNLMEEQVRSSVADYIEFLRNIEDKENVDMRWPIQVMVANIINEVLFGYRFKHDSCQPLVDYVEDFNKLLDGIIDNKGVMLGAAFPILTRLPIIGWYTFGKFKRDMQKINEYIVDNVDRAMKGYRTEDEPRCFVHAYMQKMESNAFLDQTNLYGTCSDFFLAGQETTTTTLRWAMLLFAKHQDAQEKLRQEALAVVGKDRSPAMADQFQMPYARACVLELQRFTNIITNNQRMTVRDVEVAGQMIPKDTWVQADIHFLLVNDPLFVRPEEFRPDRYIAEDGRTLRSDLVERTIPFSLGKRVCAGEGMARVELFLGLTATFQHFKITPRPGETIDLVPRPGPIKTPKPQKMRIERLQ